MPPDDERTENDNDVAGDLCRNGHPVIKTTIEIDKELYIRMKEEVARSNTSIREFVSSAAIDKLTKEKPEEKVRAGSVKDELLRNPFAKRVLAVLEQEVIEPFDIALLVSKIDKFEIDASDFSASDLSDAFVLELTRPVDFLSGPEAAMNIKAALLKLRRE
jgi:hypothetical protein